MANNAIIYEIYESTGITTDKHCINGICDLAFPVNAIGGDMKKENIRTLLSQKASKRGELKRFCLEHDLPYIKVWRFANNTTETIDLELGNKLSILLELNNSECIGEVANA